MIKILVTGSTGFVGKSLVKALITLDDVKVIGTSREAININSKEIKYIKISDISNYDSWASVLADIDVVVHTAGIAHKIKDAPKVYKNEYKRVNTYGTLRLAHAAAEAGVKRIIFLSSIKVNGEITAKGIPFTESSSTDPKDDYAKSKYEAEIGLKKICKKSKLQFTIIRPPLIYGPGVKGNFATLIKLLSANVPMPLGCVYNNRRSMVGLDNLISLIIICLKHKNARNETFLVSDNEDLSTFGLLRLLRKTINSYSIFLPIPRSMLKFIGLVLRKSGQVQRLLGSLQVDISYTCERLKWLPPQSVKNGLELVNKK